MQMNIIKKIIGSSNDRILKSLKPTVAKINDLEASIKKMSDEELRSQTAKFKQQLAAGATLDDLLVEAFATVREAAFRTLKMRHFDVQLVGGMVLHQGKIAEMRTGEGKTLVATLPAYLNALSGKGVHVVTVNDYLAKRDAEWMGTVHRFLGLEVGVVYAGMEAEDKKKAYRADITYGQNNEFGFDYLRDNMKYSLDDVMQRHHYYAIVDEVDSILIDEARTPLIISGAAEDSSEFYYQSNKVIPHLKETEDYEIDLKSKQPTLTEAGIHKLEGLLEVGNLYDPNNIELLHATNQSLKAHTCMEVDVDYVVRDGKIIIVDEFTGRLMPGRQWSDGLHQAIEAKENLKIARESQTLASITFQNLFRLYDKLSGMTGTAATEAVEFKEIYGLDCVVIPTNKPLARKDESDVIFRTREEKYQAVCEDIQEVNKTGQPILVGTISIEQSEALSRFLSKNKIAHNVLNAKQHEREAAIVAQAGRLGAVTIATNMAGRGTDIILGGNPESLLHSFLSENPDLDEAEKDKKTIEIQEQCQNEKKKVLAAGGLFIMGTERHESRRIDNQLRGRAGRQGDPGISRFYVSLEDDLMKRFGGDKLQGIMKKLGWEEGAAIDGSLISRSIEGAQKKVERLHFESRKQVTEYDDVMNKQRKVVYNLRNKILNKSEIRSVIENIIADLLEDSIINTCDERKNPMDWNIEALRERFFFLFNQDCILQIEGRITQQEIFDRLKNEALSLYAKHADKQVEILARLKTNYDDKGVQFSLSGENVFDFEYSTIEQDCFLEALDHFWNQHLRNMDHLRDGIGLRGYGQKNPLYEYQREGFGLFSQMVENMQEAIIRKLFYSDASEMESLLQHFEAEQQRRDALEKTLETQHPGEEEPHGNSQAAVNPKVIKNAENEKARLEALKKARRKNSKKR